MRKDALAECTDEPEDTAENEPGSPQPPANDDAPAQAETAVLAAQEASRNEPGQPAAATPGDIWELDGVPLLDVWGQPRRHPLAAARAAGWQRRGGWRCPAAGRVTVGACPVA